MNAEAGSHPARIGTFRAVDHLFEVEVVGMPPVDPMAVLGDLEDRSSTPPESRYRFTYDGTADDGQLEHDGRIAAAGTTRVLLQSLVTRVGQSVVAGSDRLAIHATTVRIGESAVLLAGPSRHGKSTVATCLLREGAALVAEDISVVEPATLQVRSYHRPIGLLERTFDLLDLDIPPELGERCGCGGKVLVSPARLGAELAGPAQPAVILLVDQQDHSLVPLSTAEALARVLEAGVAVTPDPVRDLGALVEVLASARCFAIGTADLRSAVDWVLQLAAGDPRVPVPTWIEHRDGRIDIYAGEQAVVVVGDHCQLLNRSAAAIWMLRSEGLDPLAIAAELGVSPTVVTDALSQLPA